MIEALAGLEPLSRPRVVEYEGWIEPARVLDGVRGATRPVLLLSGSEGHPSARFSILAWDPAGIVSFTRRGARVESGAGRSALAPLDIDPFDLLRDVIPSDAFARLPGLPFAGGAIGLLGYGLRRYVEALPQRPPDVLAEPDLWFGLYDAAALFDHAERRIALVAAGLAPGGARRRDERAAARLDDLRFRLGAARRPPDGRSGKRGAEVEARVAVSLTPRVEHRRRIERALEYIGAGDIYQVNLSHRIECSFGGDPVDLFLDLARDNPAPFAAYLDTGAIRVVSASPERFLSLHGGRASSSPIKGTRPRGRTPDEDGRLVQELLGSAKDRAENVMITDLVRNDLGRVCEPGSVHVEKLCGLESFATVHHLVSTISGRPRPGRDRVDLVRALFPGGSMTGAPKVRAMEVIDELEAEERGIYSGAIGYLSLDGGMDLNIVIRTILCAGGRAHFRVGGGIVADSDPEAEFRETMDKGRALLRALRAKPE